MKKNLTHYKPYFVGKVAMKDEQFLLEEQKKFAYKEMFFEHLEKNKFFESVKTTTTTEISVEDWVEKAAGEYHDLVEEFLEKLSRMVDEKENFSKEDKNKVRKFLKVTVQREVMEILGAIRLRQQHKNI